jgi:capsular polysaccharide transport system permease protein
MREIASAQANLLYGYAWTLVDVGIMICGLLVMKLVIRAFNPPGMPAATFLITGLVPFYLFQNAYGSIESALGRNKPLLVLPVVTELDIIFGGFLQLFVTYTIVMVVATTISSIFDQSAPPANFAGVALLFLASGLIGLFFGLVLLPIQRVYPPAGKFIGFVLRFSLMGSDVFFLASTIPTEYMYYLRWNPMLHVEELMHTYWFGVYRTPVGQPSYVIESVIVLAVLGLICERYTRKRLRK